MRRPWREVRGEFPTLPQRARPGLPITYEVSGTEPLHPDPDVVARMREVALHNCGFGCKIYGDPRSNVRVVGHNAAYGCPQ